MATIVKKGKEPEIQMRTDPEFWAHVDKMLAESEASIKRGAKPTDADDFFKQMRAKYGIKARIN
jgi:hypothetical protein